MKLKHYEVSRLAGAALTVAVAVLSSPAYAGSVDKGSCTFKGKKLYGKIQIVTSFPDVKVQEVHHSRT